MFYSFHFPIFLGLSKMTAGFLRTSMFAKSCKTMRSWLLRWSYVCCWWIFRKIRCKAMNFWSPVVRIAWMKWNICFWDLKIPMSWMARAKGHFTSLRAMGNSAERPRETWEPEVCDVCDVCDVWLAVVSMCENMCQDRICCKWSLANLAGMFNACDYYWKPRPIQTRQPTVPGWCFEGFVFVFFGLFFVELKMIWTP